VKSKVMKKPNITGSEERKRERQLKELQPWALQ
jgi:hypothetical protein